MQHHIHRRRARAVFRGRGRGRLGRRDLGRDLSGSLGDHRCSRLGGGGLRRDIRGGGFSHLFRDRCSSFFRGRRVRGRRPLDCEDANIVVVAALRRLGFFERRFEPGALFL